MADMSDVTKPKSDQLNAEDFLSGPRTFRVKSVDIDLNKSEQQVSVHLEGVNRPFKPSKSMCRIMEHFWGKDQNEYAGRVLTLFRDDEVTWAGEKVGGIRISHMSHLKKSQPVKIALAANKKQRKTYTITPITDAPKQAPPAAANPDNISAAIAAAKKGTEHFRAWWADDATQAMRDAAKTIMPQLQMTCAEIDKAKADDPFNLPPIDPDSRAANAMTDDELAQQSEQDAAQAAFEAARAAELEAQE